MKRFLHLKFVLSYLIIGLFSFLLIIFISNTVVNKYIITNYSNKLFDEANLMAKTYSHLYEDENIKQNLTLNQITIVADFLDATIWVVDKDGLIILDSSNKKIYNKLEKFTPLINTDCFYDIGKYFNSFDTPVLSVSSPIINHYKTLGYIVIHKEISKLHKEVKDILHIFYMCLLIFYLTLSFIIIAFHFLVYIPLEKIINGAKAYSLGDLNYRLDINTYDEMGYLSDTLNFMSTELFKAKDYQKTFITNVSHDFRSPLTSIKGYLEAILDGTITYDIQDKYIKRIISETERLSNLTSSILTLNSMDKSLTRTSFDINKVIKDTINSFEVQCNKKNIKCYLTFSDKEQLVYANLSQIQQVIYNLIDNAIKFSNKNSNIYISVSKKYEKAFISVKDNGIGIDSKETIKIFDRFYKSDTSRGLDKKGSGLGLAIVKDIINNHGENIDVISTPNIGSEFVFSLPISVKKY